MRDVEKLAGQGPLASRGIHPRTILTARLTALLVGVWALCLLWHTLLARRG